MAYSSPLLDLPGSIPPPENHSEQGVPWHWGDPFAEQRSAVRKSVVIDRSHREILTVSGKDRLSWLHLVISQHVTGLAPWSGTEALVLDSQGRVETHMVLAHLGEKSPSSQETPVEDSLLANTVWLDTDPHPEVTSALPSGGKQSLSGYLAAMKFWSEVDIQDQTAEFATLSLIGPEIPALLPQLEIVEPTQPYEISLLDNGFIRRMPWPTRDSFDLVIPRSELVSWWQRLTGLGIRPAGSWAFEALRAESLHARVGIDTDERTIPHEVNWVDSAAHVAKGCYRGQETVSKVHNVGRSPRLMVLLHLDGSPEISPETGDPVLLGDRTVGRVGTVVQHHELGPIALALVKRSALEAKELLAGAPERVVQAVVDPASIPAEGPSPGREAAQKLRS